MPQPAPVVVLTTWPADRDAAPLAATLVEERLAACVNLLPEMESIYTWQGRIERTAERQVIIKTTETRVAELVDRLGALHPYDVPEVLVVRVSDGAPAYLAWLRTSTESAPKPGQS